MLSGDAGEDGAGQGQLPMRKKEKAEKMGVAGRTPCQKGE